MHVYRNPSIGDQYLEAQRRKRTWKQVVAVLSCFVAAVTIGALTLPAITLNQGCQLEEHQHTDICFGEIQVLSCNTERLNLHQHTEICFDTEQNVICHYADYIIHEHDSACYDADGILVCTIPEIKEHQHDESCYQSGEDIVTDPGHTHSDACYAWSTGETPTCGLEETTGHSHDESCLVVTSELTCSETESSEHEHGDSCYTEQADIICGLEESAGHQHTETCYKQVKGELICTEEERSEVTEPGDPVLVCDKPEVEAHTHKKGTCYNGNGSQAQHWSCTKLQVELHQHTDTCFATEQGLVCGKEEHIHDEICTPSLGLTEEERQQVDAVIGLIDGLPDLEVARQAFADLEAAGNLGELSIQKETLLDTVNSAKEAYELLSEKQQAAVTNAEKLLAFVQWTEEWEDPLPEEPVVKQAVVYADASCESMLEDGTEITLTGNFPEDVQVLAYPVVVELENQEVYCSYQISILLEDGTPYELATGETVTVNIETPALDVLVENPLATVYSIPTDGERVTLNSTVNADGSVSFETDSLSAIAVVKKEQFNTVVKEAVLYTDDSCETLLEDGTAITLTGELPEDVQVVAYPVYVELDNREVFCSYQVSIQNPDGSRYEPPAGTEFEVCIQSSALDTLTEQQAAVFLVSPEGEALPLDHAAFADGSVTFTTTQLSIYAVAECEVLVETVIDAVIYADASCETLLDGGTAITLSGKMPENATVTAYPVQMEIEGQSVICAYHIQIVRPDGTVFEPEGSNEIQVSIQAPILQSLPDDHRAAVYFVESETIQIPLDSAVFADGTVSFLASRFPIYVVMEKASLPVITKEAVLYADASYESLLDDGTKITLTGAMPSAAEVRAYPVQPKVDNGELICAYDIAIMKPDGSLFEPDDGEEIEVALQTPVLKTALETLGADALPGVYYLPPAGRPVLLEKSEFADGSVVFLTNHFTTYAVINAGEMSDVYLNGTSGSDDNAGTQDAPVKSFEKAASLVAEGGTIWISGTVPIRDQETWSLDVDSAIIQRASGFTGPLVTVENGGSLTLSNVTLHGGSGTPSTSIASTASPYYSNTYAGNSAKAPLVVVNSGGNLSVADGAVLQYNSNKPDTTSGAFRKNGYVGLGGAIYCNGTLEMTGGLIEYCEAQSGGGVYVENGTFYLSGGTIDHNYARNIQAGTSIGKNYRTNAGGGIYVGGSSHMQMSGGVISNNASSREGGGISLGWLDRTYGSVISGYNTTFTMNGGTITGNEALSTGGGLNITAGCMATVSAGYITNNTARGRELQTEDGTAGWVYSGGGIYVDAQQKNASGNHAGVPGKLVIHRVVITDNQAEWWGGGIAACKTSTDYINYSSALGDGTAIYENTAGEAGQELYFAAGSGITVSETVLGGGTYRWSWNTNGATTYDNPLTDNSSAIIEAKKLATVYITNNYGYLGGGIACNGLMDVGGERTSTTSLSITKIWEDEEVGHPAYITVQILQDGEVYKEVRIYKTVDADGNESWPTYYVDGLPTGSTYTVEEVKVPGYESSLIQDGNNWVITNTQTGFTVVKKWSGDEEADRPEAVTVQLYQNDKPYESPVRLNAQNEWSYEWRNLPEADESGTAYVYSVKEVEIPHGYYCSSSKLAGEYLWEITNTRIETTTVSAEKRWGANTEPGSSVTLQLLADGEPYGEEVTLSVANEWFYLWTDLPKYTPENAPNAPDAPEIVYTVIETSGGYIVDIRAGTPDDGVKAWIPTSGLQSGQSYLLISPSGALAGGDGDTLQWMDVSDNLNSGADAPAAALWTYDGSKLKNGNGQYLELDVSGIIKLSFKFIAGSSGSTISYKDGHLSSTHLFVYTEYLSGISGGYGTAGNKSDAVTFTPYIQTDSSTAWGDTHYIVTNTKGSDPVVLPETGGIGTFPYILSGLALMGAALLIYRSKSRKRKEASR